MLLLCLLGEVVDGHVHVPLQEDRLHSRDVACIVEDDHLQRMDVKVGLTEHEYIQCINVKCKTYYISNQRGIGGVGISMPKKLAVAMTNCLPAKISIG